MVSRLSVFSTAFLLRILPFRSGFPLSRSWWAIASGVMFGTLIGFLSSPLIFARVCHPFLLLCVRSIPVIVSSHFCFLVSLMWSFRLAPASIVSALKGSASYSSGQCFRSSADSGVRPDMYLVLQPRGMHLRAHTRTRSLKDLYAFHDGEAREVMPLSL